MPDEGRGCDNERSRWSEATTLRYVALGSLDLVTNGLMTLGFAMFVGVVPLEWLYVVVPAFVMGAVTGEATIWLGRRYRWAQALAPEKKTPVPGERMCVLFAGAMIVALFCGASIAMGVTAGLAGFGVPRLRIALSRRQVAAGTGMVAACICAAANSARSTEWGSPFERRAMRIGNALDRIFAGRPGDSELIGHPVRIWCSRSVVQRVVWILSMTLGLAVPAVVVFFLLSL